MAYERNFNNTMAIWTAFRGEIEPSLNLGWVRRNASTLGFTGTSGTDYLYVYDNEKACIAISHGTRNILTRSYFDRATLSWKNAPFSAGKNYPDIISAQNGVFLCVDRMYSRSGIYASRDGASWVYSYHSPYANPIQCGATNGVGAVTSRWYVYTPVFTKSNIDTGGNWTMVGTYYDDDMLCYTDMTYHKGKYVGLGSDSISDGTHKGGLLTSYNDGRTWQRQMHYPKESQHDSNTFSSVRSVHGKLFLETIGSNKTGSYSSESHYYINLMNDSATNYQSLMHFVYDSKQSGMIPHINTMTYVQSLGMYMMFAKDILYYSHNGTLWKSAPQTNFGDSKSTAIYIPGDGFYVGAGQSYVYYAAYP